MNCYVLPTFLKMMLLILGKCIAAVMKTGHLHIHVDFLCYAKSCASIETRCR